MKRGRKKILLPVVAVLAGAATPLGFAPFSFAFIPFLTLGVLYYVWLNALTARQAAWFGFLFALGMFGTGVSWVYVSLHTFGNMAAPLASVAVILFVALLATFGALAGWLQNRFSAAPDWARLVFAMPAAWVLTEWLRGWVLTGFPWLTLGYSQVAWPLRGFGPVLGVYGVSLLVAITAGLLVLMVSSIKYRRGLFALVGIVVVWAGAAALWRLHWVTPSGEPVTATLVQGNVPIPEKWRPESRQSIIDTYMSLSSGGSDLVVWPEGAVPDYLQGLGEPFWLRLREINARGSSVLFGGVEYSSDKRFYNSAILVSEGDYADTADQLTSAEIYRKTHLVPFGDYFPLPDFLLGILDYLHIPMSNFSAWDKPQPLFSVVGHPAAVTICYEDAFGQELLPALPGAELLINISEDGWFGRSIGPLQRVQMAQMRALETGRPVLRAANTGVTAFIDYRGEVVSSLPQYRRDSLTATVQAMTGETPYSRWGNWPVVIGLFSALAVLLFFRIRSG